jgi:hypothetical protein
VATIKHLAAIHQTSVRSIYRWVTLYKRGGLVALARRGRCDKGKPRILNNSALLFLLTAALHRKGAHGTLSVARIFHSYEAERARRAAPVDGAGQLPRVSKETVRNWLGRVGDVVRVLGPEADKAFHSSENPWKQ